MGLKIPEKDFFDVKPVPSDYFGENFQPDIKSLNKLRHVCGMTKKNFAAIQKNFFTRYFSQKLSKLNNTNANIYFCDFLFVAKRNGAIMDDYFDFEFYNKSLAERETFIILEYRKHMLTVCNDYPHTILLNHKPTTNKIFAEFIHRDWLYSAKCTFAEFKNFIAKNPKFIVKPCTGTGGDKIKIIQIDSSQNIKKIFARFKKMKFVLEEIISQHELLKEFCPDTLNTIRVNTFLDTLGLVHIVTACGRFGRIGNVVDNYHGGGYTVAIDPKTGIIISDGLNRIHERTDRHPDTGKIFRGFQYPFWDKIRKTVIEMAKIIPDLHYIGWDIALTENGEVELVEANASPGRDIQQAPDSVGKLHLYKDLVDSLEKYKSEQMAQAGFKINPTKNLKVDYTLENMRSESKLKFVLENLISDCGSVLDIGCRQNKSFKSLCPAHIKYIPVDFVNYNDSEIIACDFNQNFPPLKADTCICALTAEFLRNLPYFLNNICDAAEKQILMLCRPKDKEHSKYYRWSHPFVADFTEKFLIDTFEQKNFKLYSAKKLEKTPSLILYDFRLENL